MFFFSQNNPQPGAAVAAANHAVDNVPAGAAAALASAHSASRISNRPSPLVRRLRESLRSSTGQYSSQKSLRHFLTRGEVLPHADHYRHRQSFPEGERLAIRTGIIS